MNALGLRRRHLVPEWLSTYRRELIVDDAVAGVVVTFVTIPQVVAYAFLVGLPAESGLFAAVAGLVAYSVFGSSRTLAVGPTAIVAIMALESLLQVAEPGTPAYGEAAVELALMTGMMLLLFRLLNFGALASFISHAVITGFITAAALIIIASQLVVFAGMPGVSASGLTELVGHLGTNWQASNGMTLFIAVSAVVILLFCRSYLDDILAGTGISSFARQTLTRLAPMYALIWGTVLVWGFDLTDTAGVAVVGGIPAAWPAFRLPLPTFTDVTVLAPSAFVISLVVFAESNSIGTAMATRRREKVHPNQELTGLGWANVGASVFGGFPVAGSFSRTVVNHAAGAATPLATLVTAGGVLVGVLMLAPVFQHLPTGVLAAIIVVSASQLIDLHRLKKIYDFGVTDRVTLVVTVVAVCILGIAAGVLAGMMVSFALLIRASSRPHIAVVGRVPDTSHFQAVQDDEVMTSPAVLAVRIDESLYFANSHYIENYLLDQVAGNEELRHLLLVCHATNFIDTSGVEMLESLSRNLYEAGITLHLAEVKGLVMDHLEDTDFYRDMHGRVFRTTDLAMRELGGI